MIIECQTCHARFRLDETKIKGRGARVKCRKCGEGIIVLKEEAASSLPPDEGKEEAAGVLPQEAQGRDAAPEGTPPDNLIPFPGPALPEETAPSTEGSPSPAAPPQVGEAAFPPLPPDEKDEVDLAFERILEEKRPPVSEERPGGTVESPSAGESEPEEPAPDLHAPTLEGEPAPETAPDLVPSPSAAQTSEDATPSFGEEGGFLLSDAETLDFLKAGERPEPAGGETDISLSISSAPLGEDARSPGESPATQPREPDGIAGEEFLIQGNVNPETISPGEHGAPPPRDEEPFPPPVPQAPPERTWRREIALQEPAPSRPSPALAAGLALLFLLAAGAAYLGFTAPGRKLAGRAIAGAAALWKGKAAPARGQYETKNFIGYYDKGAASSRILVIKGQVTNLSSREKSGVRVRADLLDSADKVLAEQTVYAGNILSGEALRTQSRERISKTLGNRFGAGLTNMNIPPGKSIPFMVVFFDAPDNIESYRVLAMDSE